MQRRLVKEARATATEVTEGIQLQPISEDLLLWEPSVYEGGRFVVRLQIPERYPIQPPRCTFMTPVCHPNIHVRGDICLDVLRSAWSPAWSLSHACLAILVLLDNPDATSPLNCDAGNLLRSGDVRGYSSLCRAMTKLHALPSH